MHQETKVIQIMPAAPGWEAIYLADDSPYIACPIVCWALVRNKFPGDTDTWETVEAYDVTIGDGLCEPVAHNSQFVCLRHPGLDDDYFRGMLAQARAKAVC